MASDLAVVLRGDTARLSMFVYSNIIVLSLLSLSLSLLLLLLVVVVVVALLLVLILVLVLVLVLVSSAIIVDRHKFDMLNVATY